MKRHLSEKQLIKGQRHLESARESVHDCYEQVLSIRRMASRFKTSYVWEDELKNAITDLREAKEYAAKLERKYL
jgi:hypothetical protein